MFLENEYDVCTACGTPLKYHRTVLDGPSWPSGVRSSGGETVRAPEPFCPVCDPDKIFTDQEG